LQTTYTRATALTGLRQHVSNFPGVTVDKKIGVFQLNSGEKVDLIDLPGIYSLFPNSKDEKLVVKVDTAILEKELEVPILTMSGKTGFQIDNLKKEIENYRSKGSDAFIKKSAFYDMTPGELTMVQDINKENSTTYNYRNKILAHHHEWLSHLSSTDRVQIKTIADKAGFDNIKGQISETMSRYNKFGPLVKSTISRPKKEQQSITEKIDNVITHKIIGPIIFFAIMLVMFQSIYSWSSYPMDLIDGFFGTAGSFVRGIMPDGWYTDLIVDGIIAGLGGILIFIPQITVLFLLIAVLEESGYMSRAVFMFDGLMQRFGLNGRSIVALVSSGACAIPAIMSGIFNTEGLAFMGLYLLGIVASLAVALMFKMVLPADKEGSYLMMELPQYKKPIWKNVLLTVKEKVQAFVVEAGKVILVISIALWFLASYGPGNKIEQAEAVAVEMASQQGLAELDTENLIASKRIEASYAGHLGKFIEPAIAPLGFDWKIGISLLTSFAAREVFVGTMATIYSIGSSDDEMSVKGQMMKERRPDGRLVYDFATSLSLLIFYVFALQCMSTLAVTRRETNSWKWPIIQFLYMGLMAYLGSLIVYQIFS